MLQILRSISFFTAALLCLSIKHVAAAGCFYASGTCVPAPCPGTTLFSWGNCVRAGFDTCPAGVFLGTAQKCVLHGESCKQSVLYDLDVKQSSEGWFLASTYAECKKIPAEGGAGGLCALPAATKTTITSAEAKSIESCLATGSSPTCFLQIFSLLEPTGCSGCQAEAQEVAPFLSQCGALKTEEECNSGKVGDCNPSAETPGASGPGAAGPAETPDMAGAPGTDEAAGPEGSGPEGAGAATPAGAGEESSGGATASPGGAGGSPTASGGSGSSSSGGNSTVAPGPSAAWMPQAGAVVAASWAVSLAALLTL